MNGNRLVRVGILGGAKLPTNVELFLKNIRKLLRSHQVNFELDLIIREDSVSNLKGYNIYDPGIESPEKALDMFTELTPAMNSYVSDRSPDVLFQVTEFAAHGCATVIAGKYAGVPTITRVAGDDFNEYRFASNISRIKLYLMRNVMGQVPLRLADEVVVLGPKVRSEIERRGRVDGIHELPQPIDRDEFHSVSEQKKREIRDSLGIENTERVLLSVGRLTYRKGMDQIPNVARTLSNDDTDYRWIILGSGPLRENLESSPVLDVRGKIPHSEISKYYKASDIFVHPSRIDGLPNVLLEATACGIPSIARDVGECSTIATRTFESIGDLSDLITDNLEPEELNEAFDWSVMQDRYGELLLKTASN